MTVTDSSVLEAASRYGPMRVQPPRQAMGEALVVVAELVLLREAVVELGQEATSGAAPPVRKGLNNGKLILPCRRSATVRGR